ncbi:SecF protein [Alkalidesulfovibrio alkalitolerans DSM 16529]|uniref:Protein-export membrane protein SecF n=1 Tax=Alkalidesulfovibrio alkalitolerans DSM 16529 TaxID=1121439 RepID=S7SZW0_9BACT|nr:protein translocase subunit SecF [Alkalidesulfovibrio alkalitolerans]EPR30357.1 SecF protein [Alkalidesulfovibrio alkalitolerans DSM 16529]
MGLTIIKPGTSLDFIGKRRFAFIFSAVLILFSLISLAIDGGPRYGIDFAGGMIVQVKFDKEIDLSTLNDAVAATGLPGATVQRFGMEGDREYLVRMTGSETASGDVREALSAAFGANIPDVPYEIQRLESVGPKVGADLRSQAMEALFYATLLIAIYISGRFEQRWFAAGFMALGLAGGIYVLKLVGAPMGAMILGALVITLVLCWKLRLNFALGAIISLMHDIVMVVGIFALLNKEFDLTVIAAVLTIIGYSLNDTIIVYDRIRENIRAKSAPTLGEMLNASINQTLSRTILTSGTTLLVIACLFLFGGGVIHDFSLALLIGIFFGTYSSIFIASPVLLAFGLESFERKEKPQPRFRPNPEGDV